MPNIGEKSNKPAAQTREVDAEVAGQRLDNFLLGSLKGVPRSHVYRLIRSGQVRVNSGRTTPSYRLRAGDRVRVPPVAVAARQAVAADAEGLEWLERRIVHEDARLLVLDKPAGLAVHGGSGIRLGCIEALRVLRPKVKSLELVHRLDRATSGCLLVAKRRSALRMLHGMLREGGMQKRYLALVKGLWERGKVEIDVPLAIRRRPAGEMRVRVDAAGKIARSVFRRIEAYATTASLMEILLLTGRTHQIRVHAAHVGHPLAGDERYGDGAFNEQMRGCGLERMFLHAHSIAFAWPDTGEELAVNAPLPTELAAVLDALAARS
ncbi:MAG TPA: RluA family pseudouridine synthase [Gammaproteobacteria bacterium]|nr:RluA family pseudouridine synthase [Gammaproteobacteria bacterium]